MKKIALISVSDKTGIDSLASELSKIGYDIISTGGTAKHLISKGIKIIPISEFTKFEEILEGRVKTCLLYTSPSPRDAESSRMPSSA